MNGKSSDDDDDGEDDGVSDLPHISIVIKYEADYSYANEKEGNDGSDVFQAAQVGGAC